MDTKSVGNIGEAKVLAKFVELGIPVYLPFGDNERADMIAEFNGKLNKIQVKTSVKAKNGVMMFKVHASSAHRTNGLKHIYTPDEIDYFACYNIERQCILLFKIDEVPNLWVCVRYEEPKNNQREGIRYEKDFLIENVLGINKGI